MTLIPNDSLSTPKAKALVTHPTPHYRTLIFQAYLLVAVSIFIGLAFLANTVAYFTFDVTITREIQEFQASWFSALMLAISWIGFPPQSFLIAGAIVIFLFWRGLRRAARVSMISLVTSLAFGLAIKLVVHRPRPSADLVNVFAQLADTSFPSGHVLYFTSFFGFLWFLTFTLLKPSWVRVALMILWGTLIGLVGISRIYLGQHWASDVFAAYLLGSVWLSVAIALYRRDKSETAV